MRTTKTSKEAERIKRQKQRQAGWKTSGYKPSRAVGSQHMKQFPYIGSSTSRLKVLLNSGAFDDLRDRSKPLDQQHDVQQLINAWAEDNEDCRVFKHPKSRAALKHDTNGYEIPAPSPSLTFENIPSDERATLVVDNHGDILAYKFRIPEDLHQKLVESNLFLSQAKRANYSLWAKSTEEIAMSSDYRKHLPESDNFFEHNRELWSVLDDVIRLLDPVMYQKYTNVDQFLREDEKRLAGAWHGAIINRRTGSKGEAVPHKNWKDWSKGLTAMISWGDYEGGDVKLYNLGLTFEMQPCDVLLVNARCVSYGVQEVTKGVRNELDLVVQGTTIKWRHEKVTNGALKRADERKRMERERRKAQKQRTPLGRSVLGGRRSEANQVRPPTVRPPTSTNSNAMPLGTRSTEGQEATKVEKRSGSTLSPATTNVNMQPLNIPASEVIRKILKDRVALEATKVLVTAKVLPPKASAPISAKKTKAQRREATQIRNAIARAIMDSVSTEGKTLVKIEEDRREALKAQRRKEEAERKATRKVRKVRKAAARAAVKNQAEALGKSPKELRRQLHAEKIEQPRLRGLTKKKNKEERAMKRLKLSQAPPTLDVKAAQSKGQGQKRKADAGGESSMKKQKLELAVKLRKVSAPKVKPQAATTKREVTRENVGGKMREVVCLD